MNQSYDYILIGGGAAGLSLAFYLIQEPGLADKSIMILDKEQKSENDRTWCFWQSEKSPFDEILEASWQQLEFHSPKVSKSLGIAPYTYKMLRSKDFYAFCREYLLATGRVSFETDEVLSMEQGKVIGKKDCYFGTYLFNSALFDIPRQNDKHYLLQHFKGWFVDSPQALFDPEKPVLMDFRIDQKGDCRFVYVLPLSAHKALVEYTIFSKELLSQDAYDEGLNDYFYQYLKTDDFRVEEIEYGVIPMTNVKFPQREGKQIIHIGTAGGHTKASTGYTFAFIQRKCRRIASNLANGKDPLHGMEEAFDKYRLFDSIFLRVIAEGKLPSWQVFDDLFQKLPAALVLAFLDENTTFLQDLRIMSSVHIPTFLRAALKEL